MTLQQLSHATDKHAGSDDGFAAESRLQDFCEAIVELTPPSIDSPSLLADVLPSLMAVICSSLPSRASIAPELANWERRSRKLIQLAKLHCSDHADELAAMLVETSTKSHSALQALDELNQMAEKARPRLQPVVVNSAHLQSRSSPRASAH